jgi:hypothetical protein
MYEMVPIEGGFKPSGGTKTSAKILAKKSNFTQLRAMEFAALRSRLEVLNSFRRPWFVGGGWAIDLFLGRQTRNHQDIDIVIFREDQFELRRHLANWKWKKVVSGTLVGWEPNEWFEHCLFGNVHSRLNRLRMLL